MPKMRLDKLLSECGVASRKEIRQLIRSGRVSVDGAAAASPEMKLDPYKALVCLDGTKIEYAKYHYYMMNKPAGVLSATDDGRQKTVLDLVTPEMRKIGLFPVGRLDKDTEGLLLITNDGDLAHKLLAPGKHVDKVYFVRLAKPLEEDKVQLLENGVDIGEKALTLPAKIEICQEDRMACRITIREGKFHQIKRMFLAADNEVVFLKRLSMGTLELDETLVPGQYRVLTEEEIERLKTNAQ